MEGIFGSAETQHLIKCYSSQCGIHSWGSSAGHSCSSWWSREGRWRASSWRIRL